LKLAHYLKAGQTEVGIVEGDRIVDFERLLKNAGGHRGLRTPGTIDEILSYGLLDQLEKAWAATPVSKREYLPLASVRLQSPVLRPEKIYCAAVNYLSHGKEQKSIMPEAPYFFTKFRNSIIGPEDPIVLPRTSKKVDWEVELAVVIGKRGKYIRKEEALDYVAGYTVANDVSFRDLLFHEALKQKPIEQGLNWVKGKGLDGALPLGPWLVTCDEIGDPQNLGIFLTVNGNTRQKANTSEMVFKVDEMVEYLSQGTTLEPGDIITTGTPAGVAAFSGVPFLKAGDVVEAQIEKIGALRNPVRPET
jgi:2-keto-4-pentenoate hydratase/2-oxohepta-3-ene-1,7-dioic acid hydratase in catechol pathway